MTVLAPPPVTKTLRQADLVDRFLARLVDWVALDVVLSLLLLFTPRSLALVVFLVVNLGYHVALEARRGQTLGQRSMGLRVQGPSGARPTASQSLRRHVLDAWPAGYAVPVAATYLGPLAALLAVAGALVIGVGLHRRPEALPWPDRLAGGTVVLGRPVTGS